MMNEYQPQRWMKHVLIAAAVYHLLWGISAIAVPQTMLGWIGVDSNPTANTFWRCIGLMAALFGIGYGIAASHPYRHWLVILIGGLGKLLVPIGFLTPLVNGSVASKMGWTLIFNDLIWWIPFALILWGATRHSRAAHSAYVTPESDDPLRELRANNGQTLDALADRAPQLVVFLRHAGCTFCRQSLADISKQRDQIEATGCGIVFVHLGDGDPEAEEIFQRYGLDDLPRISDPSSRLYRQFGLNLGGFRELFGLRVWFAGLIFGYLNGHGIGSAKGNTFQMPGVYLYHCGVILNGFQHERASDRPDYVTIAKSTQLQESAIAG